MKPLARIPFGPWRPDQAVRGAQNVLADVRNAIWAGSHWLPQRDLAPMLAQVLPTPIQGIFTTSRLDGSPELFVVADGHFYRIISRTDRDDLTGLSYTQYDQQETTRWRAVQFNDLLIAVNFEDPTQAYDLVHGSPMTALSAEAPRARYIAIVRDFPVFAHTADDDGTNAYRVQWPGLIDGVVDPTEFSPALATQAGFQPLSDIGQIQGLTGGQFGTILGESGVSVMQYGGDPWDFATIERRIGTRIPNSVVQYRQLTYFISPDGIAACDGNAVRMIGTSKVDEWLLSDLDDGLVHKMWAHVEAKSGRVRWLYCGRGHDGTTPNRLLTYSPALDEFSVADVTAQAMGPGKSFAISVDDIENMDTFEPSLDDPAVWLEQQQTALVRDGALSAFTGEPMTGTFEPAEWQADAGRRAMLTGGMVGHVGGTPSVRVGKVEVLGDDPAWSAVHPRQADGWFRFREPGRSHRLRVSMAGAWKQAQWADVYGSLVGGR